jgi:hypothetical protein
LKLFLGYPDGAALHANSMTTKKALLDQGIHGRAGNLQSLGDLPNGVHFRLNSLN